MEIDPILLATHYELAADRENAFIWFFRAAEKAKGIYANSEAIKYYRNALKLLTQEEDYREKRSMDRRVASWEKRVGLYIGLADVLTLTGRYKEALIEYDNALERILSKERRKGWMIREDIERMNSEVYLKKGQVYKEMGLLKEAMENYEEALRYNEKSPSDIVEMDIKSEIAFINNRLGNANESIKLCNEGLKLCKEQKDKNLRFMKVQAKLHNTIGYAYEQLSKFDEAENHFNESLKIMKSIGDLKGMSVSYNNIAAVYYSRGNLDKAVSYFKHSLRISEEVGDPYDIATAYNNLGEVELELGDYEEAIKNLKKSESYAKDIDSKVLLEDIYWNMGKFYIRKGVYEEAKNMAENVMSLAKKTGSSKHTGLAHRLFQEIYFLRYRKTRDNRFLDMAKEHFNKSMQVFIKKDMELEQGYTLINFGNLLFDAGFEEGMEYINRAKSIFTKFGIKSEPIPERSPA
jgi:tetratricopeptide (TPR) repeat protein